MENALKLAARRTTTAIAAIATAGVSSLFMGVAPASAADVEACGPDGTVIAPGVCEAIFTSGSDQFVRPSTATQLEVLLVGAGGSGADQQDPNTNGYAAAGGGGDVQLVDFSTATAPIDIHVGEASVDGSTVDGYSWAESGTLYEEARYGSDGAYGTESGGPSGSGFSGANGISTSTTPYGAGGGAAGSPVGNENGGAGVVVDDIAATGSLFDGDLNCFGGGGGVGTASVVGTYSCGAGGADSTGLALVAAVANTGGGGGGTVTPGIAPATRAGANGLVVIRYTAATVTLTFAANGHGSAPTTQTVPAGTLPVKPADPTAAGYTFKGWFTDAALTVPADFNAPITGSVTYYASWAAALAVTGVDVNPALIPIGGAIVLLGAGLMVYRRKTRAN